MEKKIIIKEYIPNYNKCFLNNSSNECYICYTNDNELILMNNNFCECFDYVIICEECFIKWFFKNCKCFICRNKFIDNNNNKLNVFSIHINNIYVKILIKMEEMHINILPTDNIHINRTTRNNIIINRFYKQLLNVLFYLLVFLTTFSVVYLSINKQLNYIIN